MLELHVWGPAFDLPSIDPQCIAAIAYLNLTLNKNQWSVVASSNPLLSPTRQFPALRDGRTWAAGFRGIVEYIRKKSNGHDDLDALLNTTDKAACTAYSAFIETHGQALIDLSLYVSRKNFDSTTRSIYATLLPFPMQYYTPVVIRSQAKSRTSGLGITALDVDTAEPPSSAAPPVGAPHTNIPPQVTKKSVLSTEITVTFKLMNLVRDFLVPLQAKLGGNNYFFGNEPSSLDCLALGYLSLCFYPELPHPWLRNEMKKGFGRMCGYLNNLRVPLIGKPVDPKEVLAYARSSSSERTAALASELPWGAVERGDLPWVSGLLVERALDAIGRGRATKARKQRLKEKEAAMDPEDLERKRKVQATIRSQRIMGALTVAGGIVAFVGYCFWSGLLQISIIDDEDDDEEEEGEDEDEGKDEDELIERMKGGGERNSFGLAGAILGLHGESNSGKDDGESNEEVENKDSPKEEDKVAKGVHAEEAGVDGANAKDASSLEGKAE